MEVNETNLCVYGVSLFSDASGQTLQKYSRFQFELLSEQLVVKTAVASHFKLPISVSGKTTGKIYD